MSHAGSQNSESDKQNNSQVIQFIGRYGVSSLFYPLEYVKVLIQIGHEPLPPRPTHTLFGRPALALPGVFRYMSHIKAVDGFFGLYRGLVPKLCANFVGTLTYTSVRQQLPPFLNQPETTSEEEEDELTEEQKIMRFLQSAIQETISRSLAILASHPLHVITIRSMAQFVGREENYRGIFSSFYHMIKEDGIKGFFVGLIPRLLAEVSTLWLAQVATFIINTYFVEDKATRSYIGTSLLYIASTITYPFTLVSNVMTVNNCGLSAGMPPNAVLYADWTDCWSHLSAMGQLKRGSSILWRYYTGPVMLDSQGNPVPVNREQFKLNRKY